MEEKRNKLTIFILMIILAIGLIVGGILLLELKDETTGGIIMGIIGSSILSQMASSPFKYFHYKKNKELSDDINGVALTLGIEEKREQEEIMKEKLKGIFKKVVGGYKIEMNNHKITIEDTKGRSLLENSISAPKALNKFMEDIKKDL